VLTIAHPGLTLGARWNTGEFFWSVKRKRGAEKQIPHDPTTFAVGEPGSSEFSSGASLAHGDMRNEKIISRELDVVA
jgi:hypothetical protein